MTESRIETIIRAVIAGKPCTLPDLTRASAPGVDIVWQQGAEARAAELAAVYRQLAEDDGDGDELTRRAEADDESVTLLVSGIAAAVWALIGKEVGSG